jgi:hypothetical protein
VLTDQLAHQRGHGVGIERFASPAGEDQAAVAIPGSSSGQPFLILLTLMLAQYSDGFTVNADDPRAATFGGALDALATHHGPRMSHKPRAFMATSDCAPKARPNGPEPTDTRSVTDPLDIRQDAGTRQARTGSVR